MFVRIAIVSYYFGSLSGEEQCRRALRRAFLTHVECDEVVSVVAERPDPELRPQDFPGVGNVAIETIDLTRFDVVLAFSYWEDLKVSANTFVISYVVNLPPQLRGWPDFTASRFLAAMPRSDLFLCNSQMIVNSLVEAKVPAAFLPMFADSELFAVTRAPEQRGDSIIFVGSDLGYKGAAILRYVEPCLRFNLNLYCFGWADEKWKRAYKGTAEAKRLGSLYTNAGICLGVTADYQRRLGMVNNRVFDVLGSAGVLLSDQVSWVEENLGEYCTLTDGDADTIRQVKQLFAHQDEARRRAHRGAALIQAKHTEFNRADEIMSLIRVHKCKL